MGVNGVRVNLLIQLPRRGDSQKPEGGLRMKSLASFRRMNKAGLGIA